MASVTHIELFDKTVAETNAWIDDVLGETGWSDRHHALQALRGTLHALRDELSVDQNAKLAAQFPTLLRGIYFEGWHPGDHQPKRSSRNDFLCRAARSLTGYVQNYDIDLIVGSVLAVLESRTTGECNKIKVSLPSDLRALWPV